MLKEEIFDRLLNKFIPKDDIVLKNYSTKSVYSLNEYQKLAEETAVYKRNGTMKSKEMQLVYPALGLNGEAGEVAECIKKMIRDDGGILSYEKKEKLLLEMGDVLWYLAALATSLGVDLSLIAQMNLNKLKKRYNDIGGKR